MKKSLQSILFAAVLCLMPGIGFATTVSYATGATATDSNGDPVKAYVTITTGMNSITIDLYNQLVNQKDVGQDISDLFLSLSNGQTTGSIASSSATSRTVAKDGSYTDNGTISTGWGFVPNTMVGMFTGFTLEDLGFAGPSNTILGAPGPGDTYSNANGSIAGNKAHNPFLVGDTRFTLTVAGVTASTTVNAAYFSFGTMLGDNVQGVVATPEPASFGLAGLGLLGILRFARRRRA